MMHAAAVKLHANKHSYTCINLNLGLSIHMLLEFLIILFIPKAFLIYFHNIAKCLRSQLILNS